MGDWIAGLEGAEAGAGADAEAGASARAEVAAPKEGAAAGAEEEETGAAGLEASGDVLDQMLQVCEQGMDAADGVVAELRRGRVLAGKREREEDLGAGWPACGALIVGARLTGGLQ